MHFKSCGMLRRLFPFLSLTLFVNAQSGTPPSSWPQTYPGMPTGEYSPEWQTYFQVTDNLPNVTWPLARNWAGNLPVQREGHPNDTLFFWAFESWNSSFTTESDEPWAIWLNGGPGFSSLVGLLFENGPIHLSSNYSLFENKYAWTTILDCMWIDQPVGTGYSTADSNGYIFDEDQMAADFMGFLANVVKVFPSLATRPLILVGESYAGMYIPYIAKAYFQMDHPPVNLARIAIGNGEIASRETSDLLPVVSVLETYPQIIGNDPVVIEYFRQQARICGYNLTLFYPQPKPFPTLKYIPGNNTVSAVSLFGEYKVKLTKQDLMQEAQSRFAAKSTKRDGTLSKRERIRARDAWKRSLVGRPNGTLDPWYGCDLSDEMVDYAVNFTFPWSLSQSSGGTFDAYNIPDALNPEAPMNASVFLNDPRTRVAIHAPTSKNWIESIHYPFASNYSFGETSAVPMAFLTDLATNATANEMKIIVFSGNDDALIPHLSSQGWLSKYDFSKNWVGITSIFHVPQNTTFGGIQGFTREPQTPWYNDAGEFAGIVHQERGWTYALVNNAGHILAHNNPVSALTLAREFIFGDNQIGLVVDTGCEFDPVVVIGGEASSLSGEIMTGQAGIYYGSATTASTYFFPTATVDAWDTFIATMSAT